jgi:hypothetical protein
LTLASWLKDQNTENETTAHYLAHFYKHANNAISSRNLVELTEASWIIAVYSMASFQDLDSVLTHFVQYSRSVIAILREPGIEGLKASTRLEWQGLLSTIYKLTDRHDASLTTGPSQKLLEVSSDMLRVDKYVSGDILVYQMKYYLHLLRQRAIPRYGQTPQLYVSIQHARYHLNMTLSYLFDFLSMVPATKEMMKQIGELCLAADSESAEFSIGCFFCTRQAIVLCMLRFLRCLITVSGDGLDDLQELDRTAHLLYILSVAWFDLFVEQMGSDWVFFEFVRQALLWASLILTKSKSPDGTTPCTLRSDLILANALIVKTVLRCIETCNEDKAREQERRNDTLWLMEKVDSCVSVGGYPSRCGAVRLEVFHVDNLCVFELA